MNPRLAAARVMAKMALADGEVNADEHWLLANLVGEEVVGPLLSDVATVDLNDLLEPIERYADRFYIAFRAYLMAHADAVFDDTERVVYEALLEQLQITPTDRKLIEETGDAITARRTGSPAPRFRELYDESSFAEPDPS